MASSDHNNVPLFVTSANASLSLPTNSFDVVVTKLGVYLIVLLVLLSLLASAVFILVATCKGKRVLQAVQILLYGSVGLLHLITIFSVSWAEAEESVIVSIGPNSIPQRTKLGIKAGIWDVIVSAECPGIFNSDITFYYHVEISTQRKLHDQHLQALRKGLAWSVLLVTAELGGEGPAWEGDLGRCLNKASMAIFSCILGSLYIWFVCGLCHKPFHIKSLPLALLILYGFMQVISAIIYICILRTCPHAVLPDGQILYIGLGWPGKMFGILGLIVSSVGCVIKLTESKRPKKFYMIKIRDSRASVSSVDETSNIYVFRTSDGRIKKNKSKLKFNGKCFRKTMEISTIGDPNNNSSDNFTNSGCLSPTILSQMYVL